jgi:hypothetical protein
MYHWNQKGFRAVLAGASALVGVTLANPSTALAIGATPGQRCAAAKIQAVATRAHRELHCYENATQRGKPVDQRCLTNAGVSFFRTFQKAEGKGGCATVGDAVAVGSTVDAFVNAIVRALPSVPPTATPTTTPTRTNTPSSTPTETTTSTPTCTSTPTSNETETPVATPASCTTNNDCVSGFCCAGAPGTCMDATFATSCGIGCVDCTSSANDKACVAGACGCTSDTDCDGVHSCDLSAHGCKLANGQTCTAGSDCASGNCTGTQCAP